MLTNLKVEQVMLYKLFTDGNLEPQDIYRNPIAALLHTLPTPLLERFRGIYEPVLQELPLRLKDDPTFFQSA